MRTSRHNALRFFHPDLSAADPTTVGLCVSHTGALAMIEGDASVRQAILLLLSTSPGERVMRPKYGCNLRSLVFSLNDQTTAGLAIHYVREAIQRWEPRVDVLELDAGPQEANPTSLVIDLQYRVRASGNSDRIRLGLDLTQD